MLDRQWPYQRHSEIFAGLQRSTEEQRWVLILDASNFLESRQGGRDLWRAPVGRRGYRGRNGADLLHVLLPRFRLTLVQRGRVPFARSRQVERLHHPGGPIDLSEARRY